MTYETILVEQHDAVTLVRLNRPQALNALNSQVLADLIAAFAAYDADASQRWLRGDLADEALITEVADNFATLVDAWRARHTH